MNFQQYLLGCYKCKFHWYLSAVAAAKPRAGWEGFCVQYGTSGVPFTNMN